MSGGTLGRILVGYAVVLVIAAIGIERAVSLDPEQPSREHICSVWRGGQRVRREVSSTGCAPNLVKTASDEGAQVVMESVLDSGRFLHVHPALMGLSIVSGRDGVKAEYRGRAAYVTPDDLIVHQAYDKGLVVGPIELHVGADPSTLLDLLGADLQVSAEEIARHASLTRFVSRREMLQPDTKAQRNPAPNEIGDANLRASIEAGAMYLVRNQHADGSFRYQVDTTTNQEPPAAYDWPRHAGTTLFLAEAAHFTHDATIGRAARLGAELLRDRRTRQCGAESCVGEDPILALGSSALALLGYVEIVQAGIDGSFRPAISALASFIRSQQRSDGEFVHWYDLGAMRPLDRPVPYYSGEAALALTRAYRITHDPRDLQAAQRALDYLVGPNWQFFGNRYYYGEEHWTCQVMGDLWPMSANPKALDFCLRWHRYNRAVQQPNFPGLPIDGGFGFGPLVQPRMAAAGSRSEAGVATLVAAEAAGVDASEIRALDHQIRRAIALIMRQQFRPGPTHLFANPEAVHGGLPVSPIELAIRIDVPQHAGCAMIRYARYLASKRPDR